MSDKHQMAELKKRYEDLIKVHGEGTTDHHAFRNALLELNREHRANAIRMYSERISEIESKVANQYLKHSAHCL